MTGRTAFIREYVRCELDSGAVWRQWTDEGFDLRNVRVPRRASSNLAGLDHHAAGFSVLKTVVDLRCGQPLNLGYLPASDGSCRPKSAMYPIFALDLTRCVGHEVDLTLSKR